MIDFVSHEPTEQVNCGPAEARGLRLAVASPFVDKRHGTERALIETMERLASVYGCEIHLYAQRVEDVALAPDGRHGAGVIVWRRVPSLPGPHLFNFLWWYAANRLLRWFDEHVRARKYDVVLTPGINCADADVIVVHIVFSEFYRLVHQELRLRNAPLKAWPRLIHRILYYRLIMSLEKRIYPQKYIILAAVSQLTTSEMNSHFARADVTSIPNGIDLEKFSPSERARRRAACRQALGFGHDDFVIVLIGNDWKKKGLDTLLNAMAHCEAPKMRLVVVGHDDRTPYLESVPRLGLASRVEFCGLSADAMQFYAAADAYAGPSLHDAFALPVLEAMACGLPAITSAQAGVSQAISNGIDGLVLQDPTDAKALAALLQRLYSSPELRETIGRNAAETARQYTWDRHAAGVWKLLQEAHAQKIARKQRR